MSVHIPKWWRIISATLALVALVFSVAEYRFGHLARAIEQLFLFFVLLIPLVNHRKQSRFDRITLYTLLATALILFLLMWHVKRVIPSNLN